MSNVAQALCVCLISVAVTMIAMLLIVRAFYDIKGSPVLFSKIHKPGDEVVIVQSHMHGELSHLVTLDGRGRKRVVYFIDRPLRDDEITSAFEDYKPGRYRYEVTRTINLGTGETTTTQSLEWLGVYIPECQKPKLRMAS